MDLFSEDQVPFGSSVSSSLSCPKDSERIELAFDVLRSQHLFRKLGVPSVVNQRSPLRFLRILGNTSSGSSLDLSTATKLLSGLNSTHGGPHKSNGDPNGFMGRDRNGTYMSFVVEFWS